MTYGASWPCMAFLYMLQHIPGFVGDSAFDAAWVDAIADQYKDYYADIYPVLGVCFGFQQGGSCIR